MTERAVTPSIDYFTALAAAFPLHGQLVDVRPHGSGHINDTFVVTFDQTGRPVRYIFQRINHHIFKDVPALMENIQRVTTHLASHDQQMNGRGSLALVSTCDDAPFVQLDDGNFWRVYLFIEGARTYDELLSPAQAFQAARAFGRFQRLLADLPGEPLKETIPAFHHTPSRVQALRQAAEADAVNRRAEVAAELEFAFKMAEQAGLLLELQQEGAMPERITHNDTKINNVMLDDATGEGICVIDLDTVMPGLSLYDFGDMVRTASSPTPEDERDLSKVTVRQPFFEALVKGFSEGAGEMLTDAEWDHLIFSGKLITYEIGVRFLTDHLQGDTYFKTHRPGHNLDRCRTQFRLVECLTENERALEEIVRRERGAK